jgi:hypothetical protein
MFGPALELRPLGATTRLGERARGGERVGNDRGDEKDDDDRPAPACIRQERARL